MMKQKIKIPDVIIIYELLFGTFELMFGLGILFFGGNLISIYEHIKDSELPEGSNDMIITFSEKLIPNLFHHRYYIVTLLLGLGIIKFVSGIGLLYKKEWAKHLLIVFLLGLVPFDMYAILRHISLFTFLNFTINLLIIFTLMQFKPVVYYHTLKRYIRK